MIKKISFILLSVLLIGCSASNTKSNHYFFKDKKAEDKYIAAYNKTMKLWPVPYEEKDIATTFGTAHVIISGPVTGEPLVLMHGMDASSTMWYPNAKDFTQKYRLYAIDFLMEAGKSVSKGEKLSDDEIVSWYTQIFDALKLEKINLMGASRGGWNATLFTLKMQNRVKKLALLAPVQTFSGIEVESKTVSTANFKFFPSKKRLKKVISYLSRRPEKISQEFKEQLYLGTKNTTAKLDMLKMDPFSDDELKSLVLPVLVLVGDHDILIDGDIIEKAGKILPDVNAAIIEDAGHFLTIDQKEEVDKRVMEFFKG